MALSVLADALADVEEEDVADLAATDYCDEIIKRLNPEQGWELRQQDILRWFGAWKQRPARDPKERKMDILQRRAAWVLRQTGYQVDRELVWRLCGELEANPAIRELADPWRMSKLETAVWVANWIQSHPAEVEQVRSWIWSVERDQPEN